MISDLLFESDPYLLERWWDKVAYEEYDFWNGSARGYFHNTVPDESPALESEL